MNPYSLIAAVLAATVLATQSSLAQNAASSPSSNARVIEKKDIRRGMVIAKPGSLTPHTRQKNAPPSASRSVANRRTTANRNKRKCPLHPRLAKIRATFSTVRPPT